MLNENNKHLLRLVHRSPDCGDGWRIVSAACWPLVESFGTPPDLLEVDKDNMRVRLTEYGEVLIRYAL